MRRLLSTLIPSIFLIVHMACTGIDRGTKTAPVNAVHIPAYGLEYRLPYPDKSIVARPDELPEGVSMCVVDTFSNVSVFLLNFPERAESYTDAERVLSLITKQHSPDYETTVSNTIDECSFEDYRAWTFDTKLHLKNEFDSISVIFHGYIFNNLALVVTAENNATLSCNFFTPYIAGLKKNEADK